MDAAVDAFGETPGKKGLALSTSDIERFWDGRALRASEHDDAMMAPPSHAMPCHAACSYRYYAEYP